MTPGEIQKLQLYLRRRFGNANINVIAPQKKGATVELHVGGEFAGTVHRDAEDGEISFAIQIVVLEEDLA